MKEGDLYISQGTDRVRKGDTIVITKLSRQGRIVAATSITRNECGCFTKGYVEQHYRRIQ